jgi:hypothetical protein
MANNVTTLSGMDLALPASVRGYMQTHVVEDELGAGITGGFGTISYKGKEWKVKFRGEEIIVKNPRDPDAPAHALEVVIVKASPHISKIWYENGYVEGDSAPPDCWSATGITPDPASPKKQSNTCAGCKWNVFGSKRSNDGQGGKGKDCSDSKRLAVVPLNDIDNEIHGGPLLLRVPAASLQDLKGYANKLTAVGAPSFAVGTKISFEQGTAYPKFVFAPIRGLSEEEATKVIALREDDRVQRILNEQVEAVRHELSPAEQKAAEPDPFATLKVAEVVKAEVPHDPVTGEIKAEAVTPKVTPAAPKPAPKPAPVIEATAEEEEDEEAKLARLLAEAQAKKAAKAAKAAELEKAVAEVEAKATKAQPTPANDAAAEQAEAPASFEAMLDGLLTKA